jgi:hypothetical protein
MSFPAANLLLSNKMPKEQQGVAASLVNTIINYSISLVLGFAGTVEGQVNRGGTNPADILFGFRAAWYLGIGMCSMGVLLCVAFAFAERRQAKEDSKEAQP